MTTRHRSGRRAAPWLRLAGGVVIAAVAACDATTTSEPPASGEPSPATESAPGTAASQPAGSQDAGVDFSNAADALNELESYAFDIEIRARNTQAGQTSIREGTTTMTGTVVNGGEPASTLHLFTSDKDGKVTDETEIVRVGETAYLRIGGATRPWQQIPAAQAETFIQVMDSFRPEKLFALYFVPIGTDTTTVGQELRNGIVSTHYRGGEDVGEILGTISGVQGSWSSDVWLAQSGGFLVASQAGVEGSDASGGGSFLIVVNITDVNAAGPVEPPI
ncbi:MAG: hypothetical protein L0221_14260 [Chloroflexi bacterium]|nr:hypothetical protein [Chloroflexota bacterium]